MKVSELRIGNLVFISAEIILSKSNIVIPNGKLIKVETIYEDGINNDEFDHDHSYIRKFDIKKTLGIPITEEWLLRMGFKERYSKSHQIEIKYDFLKLYNSNGDYIYDIGSNTGVNTIHYLHQLQNLYFALTGEELEIKE